MEQKFFIIDKCIYCGIENIPLTDEHVIPFALKGTMVLKNASCEVCRRITSKYERNSIHEVFIEARACLDYPSRKTNLKDRLFSFTGICHDGTEINLNLSREESLGITIFPVHALPAICEDKPYNGGSLIKGMQMLSFGKINKNEILKKHGIKDIRGSIKYYGNHFENMIARIAHCYLIACFGPGCLKNNYILPTILGKDDNIGFWQGCDTKGEFVPKIGVVDAPNAIAIFLLDNKISNAKLIIVSIKFFAAFPTPEYIVVVGEPTEELVKFIKLE